MKYLILYYSLEIIGSILNSNPNKDKPYSTLVEGQFSRLQLEIEGRQSLSPTKIWISQAEFFQATLVKESDSY